MVAMPALLMDRVLSTVAWTAGRARHDGALRDADTVRGGSSLDASVAALQAAVFVRGRATRGPERLGQVGWAFQLGPEADGMWAVGALGSEQARYLCTAERSVYWYDAVEDPITAMAARGYIACKLFSVERARPEAAVRTQRRISGRPYIVVSSGGVNAAVDVLRAFGATLPPVRRGLETGAWFDSIPALSLPLAR